MEEKSHTQTHFQDIDSKEDRGKVSRRTWVELLSWTQTGVLVREDDLY